MPPKGLVASNNDDDDRPPDLPPGFLTVGAGSVSASGVGGIAVGSIAGQVNLFVGPTVEPEANEAREIFISSLRRRDKFLDNVLAQALRQANLTFALSMLFTTIGGIIVLFAAILAVTRFAGSPSHGVALVSGLGGILIGSSGVAFSLRADKARKHLAQQASMMQAQITDEQRFAQVIDLLTGIKDPHLGDQARISLAMRLMGQTETGESARQQLPGGE